jgi:hypothetical protein
MYEDDVRQLGDLGLPIFASALFVQQTVPLKRRDRLRRYLRPPPGTVVICIDEKTAIQARSRKHPGQPARPGRLARREFEYVRNGALSIIAALQVATGQVVTEPIEHNDPATFTGFLHRLDQCTDPRLNIHIIMDNGPSHASAATRAWIAAHPRITVTYTPKHASWLDMAELWSSSPS